VETDKCIGIVQTVIVVLQKVFNANVAIDKLIGIAQIVILKAQ
jgi:hypothetical protein